MYTSVYELSASLLAVGLLLGAHYRGIYTMLVLEAFLQLRNAHLEGTAVRTLQPVEDH